MLSNLKFVMVLLMSFSLIGCEVTPYKHILRTDAGEDIGVRCALVRGIPVVCAFFIEKEVEVPVEVLVEVIVEKVVEVEKIVEVEKVVEIEKIVETVTTEYVNTDIDIDIFVQSVIDALPPGTTAENYDYTEVVAVVKETLETYTPPPETTTVVKTVANDDSTPPTDDDSTDSSVPKSNPADTSQIGNSQNTGPRSDPPDLPSEPEVTQNSEPEVTQNSIQNNNPQLRVHGGNSIALDNPNKNLEIRTGKHDPYVCEEALDVTAYGVGTNNARGHQHWSACKVGDDVVIHLEDHPALTCGVGPNTHELEIEGVTERVTVGEECQ